VEELHEHLRALRRLFRRRLDAVAETRGSELVDLSLVETSVGQALEELQRADRELSVAERAR
jgi:hypothetical protein